MLGRAFHDDPLWAAVMTEPEARRARLASMFTALSKATSAARGLPERTAGFEAVALWMPPGRDMRFWGMVRSGLALPRFVMSLPGEERRQITAVLGQLSRHRKRLMPQPHWYLSAIGVDPASQRRGFGTALVRSGTARADADGTPVYLETETEDNVRYYQRFGFQVAEQIEADGLELPIWLLIRPPAT